MRFFTQTAVAAALLCCLTACSAADGAQALDPVSIPTKVVQNQWLVRATVDSHEGWFLISTTTKGSILLPRPGQSGPDGRSQRFNLTLGPSSVSDVTFKIVSSPDLKKMDVAGVLGLDALANFNVAIDIESAQVSVWQDQPSLYIERGWVLLLPIIASATQHATTLSVEGDAVPTGVKASVGLSSGLASLAFGDIQAQFSPAALSQASSLTVKSGSGVDDTVVVDEVSLGAVGPFWMVGAKASKALPHAASKEIASLPVTSLPVRRVVLDGHTGTVITEILGETGMDALLLGHLLGIPLDIENSTLYVRRLTAATSIYGADFSPYAGSLIADIAGIPAIDIVAALQGPTGAKLAMLKRLANARLEGCKLDIVAGEGTKTLNIKAGVGLGN